MGNSQSIPTTHKKLFESTKDTRAIMNILLEYMIKEITETDLIALSNPAVCQKYVLLKANNLYKYFYELQVMPSKDKSGAIAFRPIEDINKPKSKDTQMERETLCLSIAYYYTRIFQIYGALALTLIDDMETSTQSGLLSLFDDKEKLLAPGQRSYTLFGGLQGGVIHHSKLLNFWFLRSFLLDEEDATYGYKTRYISRGNGPVEIYFKRPTREQIGVVPLTKDRQNGYFVIGYEGEDATKYIYLTVSATKKIGKTLLEFNKLRYSENGNYIDRDIPDDIISKKSVSTNEEALISNTGTAVTVYKVEKTGVIEYFTNIFDKLVPYVKSIFGSNTYNSSKYGTKSSTKLQTKIEQLNLTKTINNLTTRKPYGHCIARALQLLKSEPFKDQPGISSICKTKFMETTYTALDGTKKLISRSGSPVSSSALDTSPGLVSLAHLFYDTIAEGSVKIGEKKDSTGKSTLDKYIEFMKKMAMLFGDSKKDYDGVHLKDIINKKDKMFCTDKYSGDIPVQNTHAVYEYVKQLFRLQYEHAAKCAVIFKQLFDFKRDKSSNRLEIKINDAVLKGGFPVIDRINNSARQLLVDYYSNCETTYIRGMKTILDDKNKEGKKEDKKEDKKV